MKNLIQIENRTATVKLDDVVTKGLIDPLIDKIATLYGDDAVRNDWSSGEIVAVEADALETLEIEIDTVGGSVAQGYRLYKTIKDLQARGVEVIATITKTAASMGSVIAMGADKIRMEAGAMMMIHDAQASVKGDADRFRAVTKDLDQISDEIAGIYAGRTGYAAEDIRSVMKKELYMNAETALRYRFVDEIYKAEPKAWNPSIMERLIGNKAEDPDRVAIRGSEATIEDMSLLDKLKPDAALTAKLESVEADFSAQTVELEEAKNLITEAAEEITGLKTQISEITTEKEDVQARLDAETAALTTAQEELEAEKAKTSDEAINALVNQHLAAAGHPPVEDSKDEHAPSLRDQYNALEPGAERKAFRDKYAAELAAE